MDDFINPFLSSLTWPDNASSSWSGAVVPQKNNLLADSVEGYVEDKKNPSALMISSSHVIGNAAAEDLNLNESDVATSIFIDSNLMYDIDKHQYHVERSHNDSHTTLLNSGTHERSCSILGVIGSTTATKSFESSLAHSALAISNSVVNNSNELSAFPQPLGDAHSITSIPMMWPPSYSTVSSFSGQKLQAAAFQGVETDNKILEKTCLENGKFTHLDVLPTASTYLKEENMLHNLHLLSFPSGQQARSSRWAGMQSTQQISGAQSQAVNANTNGCNGAVKTRVRARRGQATDPHSISERLRRERIAERMKNLQELVPSSNKTDKASMLDEIIDYVKFLQLQVKRPSSLFFTSSVGQGGIDLPESADNLALEQEVVKLMETNVTAAMKYLENKGLCLMPTALATAISNQKSSSTPITTPSNRWKPNTTNGTVPGSSQHYMNRNCAGYDGCNGAVPKQEAAAHIPIDSRKELKPQGKK